MIILGVDPGSRFTGYGVVEVDGSATTVIEYGVFALDGRGDHHLKLREIYDSVTDVIERCKPDECAIEMPIYGKNAQSMLKLGRAQAAAILAALNRDIPVMQYTPKEVKKSVTGNGAASKEQVWYMVRARKLQTTPSGSYYNLDQPGHGVRVPDVAAVEVVR